MVRYVQIKGRKTHQTGKEEKTMMNPNEKIRYTHNGKTEIVDFTTAYITAAQLRKLSTFILTAYDYFPGYSNTFHLAGYWDGEPLEMTVVEEA